MKPRTIRALGGSHGKMKVRAGWAGASALLILSSAWLLHSRTPPEATKPQTGAPTQQEAPDALWSKLALGQSQAPVEKETNPTAESNQRLTEEWFSAVRNYREEDRGTVLDEMVEDLIARGPEIVSPLVNHLKNTSLYDQDQRSAAFHVLGRIAGDISASTSPEAKQARAAMHELAAREVKLPGLMPPDPALKLDSLSANERHALLHSGMLIEKDGQLYQSSARNKLSVIRMLTALGDSESLSQLQALGQASDNSVGVKLAVGQAIELASK